MTRLALKVDGLQVALGPNLILDNVNFTVQEKELAALVGCNGAGKTTLLRVIAGLLEPLAGTIELFESPITAANRKLLSYLPQKSNFDPLFPLRVADVVQLGWTSWPFFYHPSPLERERVDWCLEQVGLPGLKERFIGELSVGQQQLVFLARTLYGDPRLVLLDEPTTGLDVAARQRFYSLLKELRHKLGLTMLIVTHDLDAVLAQGERVILLEGKRVTYQGTPDAVGGALAGLLQAEAKRPCLKAVD